MTQSITLLLDGGGTVMVYRGAPCSTPVKKSFS